MTAPPSASPASSTLLPAGLRCAHLVNPLGVAPDRVRLSWQLQGSGPDRAQTAYQLVVTAADPGQDHGGARSGIAAASRTPLRPISNMRVARWPAAAGTPGGSGYGTRARRCHPGATQPGSRWSWIPAPDGAADWIGLGPIREEFRPPSRARAG